MVRLNLLSVANESVVVCAKPTNSVMHVLPSTCYPKRNIINILKNIALRLI